jgi:hypothetical protein
MKKYRDRNKSHWTSMTILFFVILELFCLNGQSVADDPKDDFRPLKREFKCGGSSSASVRIDGEVFNFLVPNDKMAPDPAVNAQIRLGLKYAFAEVAEEKFRIKIDQAEIESHAEFLHKTQENNAHSLTFTVGVEDIEKIKATLRSFAKKNKLDKVIEQKISVQDSEFKSYLDGNGQIKAAIGEKFEKDEKKDGMRYDRYIVNNWWRKFYQESDVATLDWRIIEAIKTLRSEGDFPPSFFDIVLPVNEPTPFAPRRVYP